MAQAEVVALEAEVQRRAAAEQQVTSLLALAEIRVAAAQRLANELAQRLAQIAVEHVDYEPQRSSLQVQQENEALVQRLRRLVVSAIHPDKAEGAAEGEWRTRLCQYLFPEIDRLMREVATSME